MIRYPLPEHCRIGMSSTPIESTRWLPALADAMASHARTITLNSHFPWTELALTWLCEDQPAPLPCTEPIDPLTASTMLRALALCSKPLVSAGVLAQDRVDRWARTMLVSAQLQCSHDPGDAAGERPSPDGEQRWRPGQPRLTHPAFRPVVSWCVAELLRRELLAEALSTVREAPRIWRSDGTLHLGIGDAVRYWFDAGSRTLGIEARDRWCGDRQMGNHAMSMTRPLPNTHWLDRLLVSYEHRVKCIALVTGRNESEVADIGDALGHWLRSCLLKRLRENGDLRALRRRLLAAYPLQADLLRFAWRVRTPGHRPLSGRDYELVWQHHDTLVRLQHDSPALFPIFIAVFSDRAIRIEDGYHELKQALIAAGMSNNAWQRLAQSGYRAVRPFRDCFSYQRHPASTLVRYFNVLAACRRTGLPPSALAQAIADNHHRDEDGRDFHLLVAITRAGWDEAHDQSAEAIARFVDAEFRPLLHLFALGHWRPVTLPSGVRWPWFRRQLQLAQHRLSFMPLLQTGWTSAIDQHAHNNLVAIALTNGAALWEEAVAMRNCLGKAGYVHDCIDGRCRLFSIRDRLTGKRRATVRLEKRLRRWWLAEIAGFANRTADDGVTGFAQTLPVAYEAASTQADADAIPRDTEPEPEPEPEPVIVCRRAEPVRNAMP